MKLGIQTNVWQEELHVADMAIIAKEAKQAGYDGFEVGFKRVNGRYSPTDLSKIAADQGVAVLGIHDGARFNEAVWWEGAEERCQTVASYAAAAGAKLIMMSGQSTPHLPSDLEKRAEKLNRLGGIAQQEGVSLCFHNHDWEFRYEGKEMAYLVEHTDPNLVSLLLDVGWVSRAGEDTAVTIQNLLSRTLCYHIKDETADQEWTEVGSGVIDWASAFDGIGKNGRCEWLIVERDLALDNAMESSVISSQYVRNSFPQLLG